MRPSTRRCTTHTPGSPAAASATGSKRPNPNDIRAGLRKTTPGWARTELDEARVVQSSADKVHFAVKFTRRDTAGNALEVHRSFYVVTNIEGRWAIQLRSSFVPTRQR